MTLFDWLNTNDGHTALLALIGLLNAGSYYLWWLSHTDRAEIRRQLDGHLDQHALMLANELHQAMHEAEKNPPAGDTGG